MLEQSLTGVDRVHNYLGKVERHIRPETLGRNISLSIRLIFRGMWSCTVYDPIVGILTEL